LNASFAEVAVKFPSPAVDHLAAVFKTLESQGITSQVQFDPSILRGMDYYTGTVFEIFDESPENRRAMFGGGRYDNLVGLFGKHTLSGIGFGMGDVTFRDFLDTHQLLAFDEHAVDVYVTLPRREDLAVSEQIARDLRAAGLRVVTPLEVGTFGTQLKQAVKVKSRFVVLLGESELTQGKVQIKRLSSGEQALVLISEIAAHILLVLRSSLS
jgi:histidyl-tRNA synthetase